jgi:4a-hydroxytetrahydrobiopterin dehydratase
MPVARLSETEIQAALAQLAPWSYDGVKLHREYQFADFVHAFGFMATAAIAIEKRNHHPDWANSYNRVTVDLTTHDSGGVTRKDVELAALLDGFAARLTG